LGSAFCNFLEHVSGVPIIAGICRLTRSTPWDLVQKRQLGRVGSQ
jgi:hypothetical protein